MKHFVFMHQQYSVLLIASIIITSLGTAQSANALGSTNRAFYPYDSGIVYMLPSNASSPYWMQVYGDRTDFYVYANLSLYKNGILGDLDVISRYYRFIVRILPLDDTAFFYYNLRLMDSWAAEKNLKVLYAFFPKSKYGPENSYLISGTAVNDRLVHDMLFVGNLSSTIKVAVWYGWKGVQFSAQEIRTFYYSLPQRLKELYCVWLDGSFVKDAVTAGLQKLVDPLNITVVTELYSTDFLSLYGSAFERQLIVSGSSGDHSTDQWQAAMQRKLNSVRTSSSSTKQSLRRLIVWMFWDRDDGSGEQYTAYLNGALSNPLLESVPSIVYLDQSNPVALRVNVDSVVPFAFHFSWPDGFNATDVTANVNGTEYQTDTDGWIAFNVSSDRVVKLTLVPQSVKWGSYELNVVVHSQIPQVVFDQVLVELSAYPNPAEVGTAPAITAKGIYASDGTPFPGSIVLNRSTFASTRPGIYAVTVVKIGDPLYSLTAFKSNVLTVTIYERPAMVAADPTQIAEISAILLVLAAVSFGILFSRKRVRFKKKLIG